MVAGSRGNKAHSNRSVAGSKGGWGGRGKAHSNRSVPGSKGGGGGGGARLIAAMGYYGVSLMGTIWSAR